MSINRAPLVAGGKMSLVTNRAMSFVKSANELCQFTAAAASAGGIVHFVFPHF
jgi:hypothetical protein